MYMGTQKLLKDYLKEVMKRKGEYDQNSMFKTTYRVNIVDRNTGEVYFDGDISWISPDFVSDKLVYDSEEYRKHTIYVKEVE